MMLGKTDYGKSWKNSGLREKFNFVFSRVFASINKIFILAGGLGTRLLFYKVLRLS